LHHVVDNPKNTAQHVRLIVNYMQTFASDTLIR